MKTSFHVILLCWTFTAASNHGLASASPPHSNPRVRGAEHSEVIIKRDLEAGDDYFSDDEEDEDSLCFSKSTMVATLNKGAVSMKDLAVGDKILTSRGYQPVYAFGHQTPDQMATFVQLYTQDNNSHALEMTAGHLVFLANKVNPVTAGSIQVGDILRGQDGPLRVTKIGSVSKSGIYAPLTESGDLVVEGIVASSYVALTPGNKEYLELAFVGLSHHAFLHWMASPLRLVCLGISHDVCNLSNDEGVPHVVNAAGTFFDWTIQQPVFIQLLVLLLVSLVVLPCWILEAVFGASLTPHVAFTTIFGTLVYNKIRLKLPLIAKGL